MKTKKQKAKRRIKANQRNWKPGRATCIQAIAQPNSLTMSGETNAKECKALAYTGGLLNLPNFPFPVVVDLGTAVFAEKSFFVRGHDMSRTVGHIESTEISASEINVVGALSFAGNERDELVETSRDHFPLGASIGTDPIKDENLEQVPPGETRVINGQSQTGPFLLARHVTIREVTICPCGVDVEASVSIAAQLTLGDVDMTFEEWAASLEIDLSTQDEAGIAALQIVFDSIQTPEVEAEEDGEDDGEEKEVEAEAPAEEKAAPVKAEKKKVNPQAGKRVIQASQADLKALFSMESAPRVQVPQAAVRSQVIEASLMLNSGCSPDDLVKRYGERAIEAAQGKDMRGYGLKALFTEVSGAKQHQGFNDGTIRAALETTLPGRAIQAAGFTTTSLPGLMSNVANKSLLATYDQWIGPGLQLMRPETANDFKQNTSLRFSMGGGLQDLGPTGEIKHATTNEDSYTSQVKTKAEMITLTREMIVNDDLGAFNAIPTQMGMKAARSVDLAFHTLLLANTGSFYSSANKNLVAAGSTEALSIDGLTAAETLFMNQTDANGDPIIVGPKFLFVPPALKTTANVLMTATTVNETTTANTPQPNINPYAGAYEVIVSPYLSNANLTGYSATAWYLFADPNLVPSYQITYLNGQRTPTIENSDVDFNQLGMSWRTVFDFGVDQVDFRGSVMSDGAD